MSWLNTWIEGVNFTRKGNDQSLGRDIAMKIVERIADRGTDQQSGIAGEWPKNAPNYAAYKEKRYGVANAPNIRTGQMLSAKSLYGKTIIEAQLITMKYGIDAPPGRTATGVPLSKADEKVTDVQKAYFAHTGQSKHKITRPFYQVDASDGVEVVKIAQENINDYIRATNRANGY